MTVELAPEVDEAIERLAESVRQLNHAITAINDLMGIVIPEPRQVPDDYYVPICTLCQAGPVGQDGRPWAEFSDVGVAHVDCHEARRHSMESAPDGREGGSG